MEKMGDRKMHGADLLRDEYFEVFFSRAPLGN